MKILFVTDLHGDERKYEWAYAIAEYEKVDAVCRRYKSVITTKP